MSKFWASESYSPPLRTRGWSFSSVAFIFAKLLWNIMFTSFVKYHNVERQNRILHTMWVKFELKPSYSQSRTLKHKVYEFRKVQILSVRIVFSTLENPVGEFQLCRLHIRKVRLWNIMFTSFVKYHNVERQNRILHPWEPRGWSFSSVAFIFAK